MLKLKGCKRCSGDLFPEGGIGEADFVCLQCGHRCGARPMLASQAFERLPKTA